ncbi:hypothetical protein D3C79_738000 [compost metagenome]
MRQVADFVGDHGETAPGFTGTGRLDRGIQGQQVGLLGNAADHIENLADVGGVGIERFDVAA